MATEDNLVRKLTTILATDVVGYSKLMGADEEGTLKSLKAIRRDCTDPLLDRFGGRIFKTTGDGFLVEFQSVVDAVNCSILMQRKIKDFNISTPIDRQIIFRMGINLGDVILDDDDIFGDGVNIAARLESISDKGGLCISQVVKDQITGKVPFEFTDRGEQSVKNIAKPVRVYGLTAEDIENSKNIPLEPRFRKKLISNRNTLLLLLTVSAVAVAAVALSVREHNSKDTIQSAANNIAVPEIQPSIAVLPFVSQGDGKKYDYFTDGITEEIITALGRFPDIKVISLNGVLNYKDKQEKPSDIGKELSVKYILTGSIYKTSDHIRISALLSSTDNNALIWSENYDVSPNDIFNAQDQITRRIAGTLIRRLSTIELSKIASKPANNLEAYDLVLHGRELISRVTRSSNAQARSLFKKAIESDPNYAPAYIGLGEVELNNVTDGWTADPQAALEKAETFGRKAIELDPSSSAAYTLLGHVYIHFADYDHALDEMKRAVDANKSDPEAYAGLGTALLWSGDINEAIKAFEMADQLGPNLSITESMTSGISYFLAGRYQEAKRTLERALEKNSQHSYTRAVLAAVYSELGQIEEAKREAGAAKQLNPRIDHSVFGNLLKNQEQRDKISKSLAKVGL